MLIKKINKLIQMQTTEIFLIIIIHSVSLRGRGATGHADEMALTGPDKFNPVIPINPNEEMHFEVSATTKVRYKVIAT